MTETLEIKKTNLNNLLNFVDFMSHIIYKYICFDSLTYKSVFLVLRDILHIFDLSNLDSVDH